MGLDVFLGKGKAGETWTVHWCEKDGNRVLVMGGVFGFAHSEEEILTRVEQRINANPQWAANWLQNHGPGEFYPVEVQRFVMLHSMPAGWERQL